MPYRRSSELPARVRDQLPARAQEIYRKAYNAAWEQYADPKKRRGGSREETAHRVAWAAVRTSYEKSKSGAWRKRA